MNAIQPLKPNKGYTNEWLCHLVLPITLGTFIRFIHKLLRSFVRFIMVYFDNILNDCPTLESHLEYLCAIFDTLKKERAVVCE